MGSFRQVVGGLALVLLTIALPVAGQTPAQPRMAEDGAIHPLPSPPSRAALPTPIAASTAPADGQPSAAPTAVATNTTYPAHPTQSNYPLTGLADLPRPAVACSPTPGPECRWTDQQLIPFSSYGPGEYAGPARLAPMSEYRLRHGDLIRFVFRLTRDPIFEPYRLNVGDIVLVESVQNSELNREVVVQPDGSVTLLLIGPVPAAGRTIPQLQADISERYATYYRDDVISITPKAIDTKLRDLLATVDNRAGVGGQSIDLRITPEGTVQLPAIGSVVAQGLTLDELGVEIAYRYRSVVHGLGVTPILLERATPFAYVLGEVTQPQRITLERPTTVMQAIAAAGGWRVGGNLRQIVVFRRTDSWGLMATRIDLRGALLGKRPCPADEIWLRDSDIVLIPKTPLRRAGDLVEELFTHGANEMILFGSAAGVLTLSTL